MQPITRMTTTIAATERREGGRWWGAGRFWAFRTALNHNLCSHADCKNRARRESKMWQRFILLFVCSGKKQWGGQKDEDKENDNRDTRESELTLFLSLSYRTGIVQNIGSIASGELQCVNDCTCCVCVFTLALLYVWKGTSACLTDSLEGDWAIKLKWNVCVCQAVSELVVFYF